MESYNVLTRGGVPSRFIGLGAASADLVGRFVKRLGDMYPQTPAGTLGEIASGLLEERCPKELLVLRYNVLKTAYVHNGILDVGKVLGINEDLVVIPSGGVEQYGGVAVRIEVAGRVFYVDESFARSRGLDYRPVRSSAGAVVCSRADNGGVVGDLSGIERLDWLKAKGLAMPHEPVVSFVYKGCEYYAYRSAAYSAGLLDCRREFSYVERRFYYEAGLRLSWDNGLCADAVFGAIRYLCDEKSRLGWRAMTDLDELCVALGVTGDSVKLLDEVLRELVAGGRLVSERSDGVLRFRACAGAGTGSAA